MTRRGLARPDLTGWTMMLEEAFGDLCLSCGAVGCIVRTVESPLDVERAGQAYRIARQYRCPQCDARWTCTLDVRIELDATGTVA